MTGRPEPICPQIHSSLGYVCWPAKYQRDLPHASTYCCGAADCVEDAADWVESVTGHRGEWHPFVKQTRNR